MSNGRGRLQQAATGAVGGRQRVARTEQVPARFPTDSNEDQRWQPT